MKKETSTIDFNQETEIYFEPISGAFNITPFYSGVSSMNDIDKSEILEYYKKRFEEAWITLADK